MRELTVDEMDYVSGGACGDPGGCDIVITAQRPQPRIVDLIDYNAGGSFPALPSGFGGGAGGGIPAPTPNPTENPTANCTLNAAQLSGFASYADYANYLRGNSTSREEASAGLGLSLMGLFDPGCPGVQRTFPRN